MTSESKERADPESTFSYGVRELSDATAAQGLSVHPPTQKPKPAKEICGVDHYNTSGGFDRKKNWTRVGKR